MLQIRTSVKVKNPDHPRAGTAGQTWQTDPAKPDQIGVKFDIDDQVEFVDLADLQAL